MSITTTAAPEDIALDRIDPGNRGQVRDQLNPAALEEYTFRYRNDLDMDPIVLVTADDGSLIIADGHHRVAAALAAGKRTIRAIIGSRNPALPVQMAARLAAVQANTKHGVKLSRREAKRSLIELLRDYPANKLSHEHAARLLNIGAGAVRSWRTELGVTSPGASPPHLLKLLWPNEPATAQGDQQAKPTSEMAPRAEKATAPVAFHLVHQYSKHPDISGEQAVGVLALMRQVLDSMPWAQARAVLESLERDIQPMAF